MPTDDLTQHATSDIDFYSILGVTFETSESDIRRAYRRTALKYHPDKNVGNVSAVEKFHLLQIAYDVLTDPAVKAAYDNARAARLVKRRQKDLLDGRRRQMVNELERREQRAGMGMGMKRGRTDDNDVEDEFDAEEKLRREVARLAEDGKRRRKEREEMLRREMEERAEADTTRHEHDGSGNKQTEDREDGPAQPVNGVSEIDRTIKVRWARETAGGAELNKEMLTTRFSKFGVIDSAFLLKDKKQRVEGSKTKRIIATGVIQFASIVGAHAAVQDFPREEGQEWKIFDSVYWASNKEPEFRYPSPTNSNVRQSSPAPDAKSMNGVGLDGSKNTPTMKMDRNGKGATETGPPSFKSFTPKANTSRDGSHTPSEGIITPSLEEITLIRLKNAERKKLEDELRRKEAEEERLEQEELERLQARREETDVK
ncbi:MAG: hypothetical protein M1823_000928 [Watsoniomyces obsoletus]|nr:MAG: hypothetical protein M1823_000928 [Watsoniomyces obsoletus]